ncbi:MAG: gliding motility-associated C-terminal domain-containing protein [Bacteroidia bacterium]
MWIVRIFVKNSMMLIGIMGIMLAQSGFQVNGSATDQGGGCFELTPNLTSQAGSVWNLNQIDLNQPFDVYVDINLGCSNGGADGMAFVLQQVSTSVGSLGGGLGYLGIMPSIAIELDTWQNGNSNDPVFDHIAIMSDGVNDHATANNLAGPVGILPGNADAEDCNFHDLRVTWDPVLDSMEVYVDCILVLGYSGDIVNTIFNGNSMVFWGATAATGAATNRHQMCLDYISFINRLNNYHVCQGDTVRVDVGTGTAFAWTPATGIDDPTISTPKLFPDTTTLYRVTVTDECGDTRVDSTLIVVDDPAALAVNLGNDTLLCPGQSVRLRTDSTAAIVWNNGTSLDNLLAQNAGWYWAEKTNLCGTNRDSLRVNFERNPSVNLGPDRSLCDRDSFLLDATFVSQSAFGTNYLWQDGSTNARFYAKQDGQYWVTVTNYCGSANDSINLEFRYSPESFSFGADRVLCSGDSLVLNMTTNNANYRWSDNSSDSTLIIKASGTYWGERYNSCGTRRDEISVIFDDSLRFDLGPDQLLCLGEQLRLDMGNFPRTSYRWNTGAASQDIFASSTGLFIGTASNVCNSFSDSVLITVDEAPDPVNLVPSLRFCIGESRLLDATVAESPTAPVRYFWQPSGDTTPTFLVREAGTFSITISNRCGSRSDQVQATTVAPPEVADFPDSSLCTGEIITVDASWPGASYRWQDGLESPSRNITQGGFYSIQLMNECGSVADSFYLEEFDCSCPVHMPTAFSPNGDGFNETFTFSYDCLISDIRLEVYDRWGRQVFLGEGPDASWDGRYNGAVAQEGVYVWVLEYTGRHRRNDLRKRMKGTVTLLR